MAQGIVGDTHSMVKTKKEVNWDLRWVLSQMSISRTPPSLESPIDALRNLGAELNALSMKFPGTLAGQGIGALKLPGTLTEHKFCAHQILS